MVQAMQGSKVKPPRTADEVRQRAGELSSKLNAIPAFMQRGEEVEYAKLFCQAVLMSTVVADSLAQVFAMSFSGQQPSPAGFITKGVGDGSQSNDGTGAGLASAGDHPGRVLLGLARQMAISSRAGELRRGGMGVLAARRQAVDDVAMVPDDSVTTAARMAGMDVMSVPRLAPGGKIGDWIDAHQELIKFLFELFMKLLPFFLL